MTIEEARKGVKVKLTQDYGKIPAFTTGRILGGGLGWVIVKWRYNIKPENPKLKFTQTAYGDLDVLNYMEKL